jgi:hypothetical protein
LSWAVELTVIPFATVALATGAVRLTVGEVLSLTVVFDTLTVTAAEVVRVPAVLRATALNR